MKIWTQFVETEVAPKGPRMSKPFEHPSGTRGGGLVGEIVSVEIRSTGYVVIWAVPDEWEPPDGV